MPRTEETQPQQALNGVYILVNDGYKIITKYTQNYTDSLLKIRGTDRDRNYQNQCPGMLLVRVWKGEEDWVFGWNRKLKKKENLDSVDYM